MSSAAFAAFAFPVRGPLAEGAPQPKQAASRFALAIVSDPHGRATVDIGMDDFVVQEAGANREVLDVRVADYPVVIVLDNGASARPDFASIRSAVTRFIERLGPRPIAIVTTAPEPTLIARFEDERPAIMSALEAVDMGGTADGQPLRAASLGAETIRETGALFSAVVVAAASPVEVAGPAGEPLLAPIIDSRAVVHIVANDRVVGSTGQFLRAISQQTHGDFTAIYSAASYQPALDRIVERLTTEMLIEYLVPVGSKANDVKIGVRIPGARVRGLGVAPR